MKRELEIYIPLYPMVRIEDNNMYIGVLLMSENDNVWTGNVKPEYWILIDINNDKVLSFNKTGKKNFIIGSIISKNMRV